MRARAHRHACTHVHTHSRTQARTQLFSYLLPTFRSSGLVFPPSAKSLFFDESCELRARVLLDARNTTYYFRNTADYVMFNRKRDHTYVWSTTDDRTTRRSSAGPFLMVVCGTIDSVIQPVMVCSTGLTQATCSSADYSFSDIAGSVVFCDFSKRSNWIFYFIVFVLLRTRTKAVESDLEPRCFEARTDMGIYKHPMFQVASSPSLARGTNASQSDAHRRDLAESL